MLLLFAWILGDSFSVLKPGLTFIESPSRINPITYRVHKVCGFSPGRSNLLGIQAAMLVS